MYNTSVRIIKDEHLAEDIMQEAFLSAFTKIDTYNGEVTFGAWLKRIVINKSIDYLKKQKIKLSELGEEHEFITEEEDWKYENDGEVEKVRNAINRLADGYRIVLSLYLLEGYDHEEIGQILEISSSTSRSQFTRAKQKLIQLLN